MQATDTISKKTPSAGADLPDVVGTAVEASAAGTLALTDNSPKRVALIGADGIAALHAEALRTMAGVTLAGIIDPCIDRAANLAHRNGGVAVSSSLAGMLDSQQLDMVHILTSADRHADLARDAMSRGLSVLVEAPMASEIEGAESLAAMARSQQAPRLTVNHAFLFHPTFLRLAEMVKSRRYGKLINLSCTYAMPVPELTAGQWKHWMFRRPANLLLEQAVRPLSQILSLTGPIGRQNVLAGAVYGVSSPSPIPRTLSIALAGQNCEAQIYLHFGSSYPVWQINALCTDGIIKADLVGNRLLCEEMSKNPEPLDNFIQARRAAFELRKQTRAGLFAHGRSLLGLDRRSDGFFQTVAGSLAAFYRGERPWLNAPDGACEIVRLCEGIAAETFPPPAIRSHAPVQTQFKPDVVVLGGSGFIGHHIVKAFAGQGLRVAAISRTPAGRCDSENVRFLEGDLRDCEKLARLVGDAPFLVNAAQPDIMEDWRDCERRIYETIGAVNDACRLMGVRRLIHLSSITALYLGDIGETLSGRACVDPIGWQRASYPRAKGAEEIALLTYHEEVNLPVCILRPAIVVGEGGTPYHAAVGLFKNERHCLGWNCGLNPLPFVLAEDVASAVVAATQKDGVLGRCYNLAGDVRLSGQEYIAALGKALDRPLVFHPRSPGWMCFAELAKWGVKRTGGRKVAFPRIRELLSRTMVATIDCTDTKLALGWAPVSDRETFIARSMRIHADRPN